MKNFNAKGWELDYTNPATDETGNIKSGDVVVIGDLVAVATVDILFGETGAVLIQGVVTVPKETETIAQGKKLYYVVADNKVTETSSGNKFMGYAYADAASDAATCKVVLSRA